MDPEKNVKELTEVYSLKQKKFLLCKCLMHLTDEKVRRRPNKKKKDLCLPLNLKQLGELQQ